MTAFNIRPRQVRGKKVWRFKYFGLDGQPKYLTHKIKNELDKTIDGRNIEDPKMRNEMFGQYDHLRTYGKDFFEKVEKHGFKVQREVYCDNLSDHKIKKYGLIKDEIIPVCIKV